MNHKKTTLLVFLIFTALLFGCTLSSGEDSPTPNRETQAALAVEATLTSNAGGQPPPQQLNTDTPGGGQNPPPLQETYTPPPTYTPFPTFTPANTQAPVATTPPCDKIGSVVDLNVPDGTQADPGQVFPKTWRLKNAGSCTWTPGYDLVFHSGDSMGAPAALALPGNVAPGDTVDVTVNLTAPIALDTYKGFFKLRNDSGEKFGWGGDANQAFWVEIKVTNPPGPTTHNVTLTTSGEGSVRSDGTIIGFPNVGDTGSNFGSQAFLKFDISGIPSNATITDLKFIIVTYDTLDDPFADLGCLLVYPGPWFPLDAGDYTSSLGALKNWCAEGNLSNSSVNNDFINALQTEIGGSTFELRFHFKGLTTDNDNTGDMVRFGVTKLKITYTTP